MKKKNKKNHVRSRLSTILLCSLAILLCAAPRGWADVLYDGEEHDVKEDIIGCLVIGNGTTVNLYASVEEYVTLGPHSVLNIYYGGSVEQSVYVGPDSVLNIYSGNVDWFISISQDELYAVVTVYGTKFAVNSQLVSHGQVVINDIGELTGTYGNGDSINLTFYCPIDVDVPIQLRSPAVSEVEIDIDIDIDIKPGGNPNNINPRSKGVVPVAILSTETFNASNVDPESVTFAGAEPVRSMLCDVDGDGNEDMLFHFKTQELFENDLNEDSTGATLTGETNSGDVIAGTDKVWIVPRKK